MELAAPAIWLRDNCSCERCRHANGQKLHGVNDLAADLRVAEINEIGDEIRVRFHGDPHEAVFDRAWLSAVVPAMADDDGRTEDAKRTWAVATCRSCPNTTGRATRPIGPTSLEAVLRTGFVLLRGVPTDDGAVLDVAGSFGFVRVTNYGDLFDVRVAADPNNLAFTSLPISPHTDNPYRDPVPTLQLLHCLRNAAQGGDSGLVDGFRAAALLRTEQPDAFDVLTSTEVTFAFSSVDTELRATRPMIGLDTRGRIREVRFNNRSLQPVRGSADRVEVFYRAYRAFAEILDRPELRLVLQLAARRLPGFRQHRVLHARTVFDSVGPRHLQGCYADSTDWPAPRPCYEGNWHERGIVTDFGDLLAGAGGQDYLGEVVTVAAHLLQVGGLARAAGAPDALVAASLLHDVGHLVEKEQSVETERHDDAGAGWLATWFGEEVTEPVRLHVLAKRYLCTVEPSYFDRLSPASVHTLGLAGRADVSRRAGGIRSQPVPPGRGRGTALGRRGQGPGRGHPGLRGIRTDAGQTGETRIGPVTAGAESPGRSGRLVTRWRLVRPRWWQCRTGRPWPPSRSRSAGSLRPTPVSPST